MASVAKRLLSCSARPLGCVLALLCASPASAQDGLDLFSGDVIEVSGDLRLVAVDDEKGWIDGGFGKLRSGSNGDLRVRPQLGNIDIVWKPQFGWSLSAVVVGSLQGGQKTEAGLSQAFLEYRPMRARRLGWSGRAGLMWPPVSLEHEGADWHVRDSITPSAINSWIGEEVRPLSAEATLAADFGDNKLRATAALIAANDTSGTLLTFRGWALHDRTTLAFQHQPLPPLDADISMFQAPYTHPLIDLDRGFAKRPGYYAKLSWQTPLPLRIELFRYDNRANPEVDNDRGEWGWRTDFDNAGLVAQLGSATLRAQAMRGQTVMGYPMDGRRWVDGDFKAAFALLSVPVGPIGLAARIDGFAMHNHGSRADAEYDDRGWSAMLAGKREFGRFTGLLELVHVSSRRDDREALSLAPRQRQTQLQAELRTHW